VKLAVLPANVKSPPNASPSIWAFNLGSPSTPLMVNSTCELDTARFASVVPLTLKPGTVADPVQLPESPGARSTTTVPSHCPEILPLDGARQEAAVATAMKIESPETARMVWLTPNGRRTARIVPSISDRKSSESDKSGPHEELRLRRYRLSTRRGGASKGRGDYVDG
jgi:hypothetical protein